MSISSFLDEHVKIIHVGYPGKNEPRLTGVPDEADDLDALHTVGCTCPECQPDYRHDRMDAA
jgi:hypothetical protein